MIGRQTQTILKSKGYLPAILTRGDSLPEKNIYHWDPVKKTIDSKALDQCFGVINLAGTNIGQWPWTKARKQEIASSRIESTTFLMEQIRTAPHPPEVYINASATGFTPMKIKTGCWKIMHRIMIFRHYVPPVGICRPPKRPRKLPGVYCPDWIGYEYPWRYISQISVGDLFQNGCETWIREYVLFLDSPGGSGQDVCLFT